MGGLKNFLKSRFFLVALSVAFLASIIPVVLTAMGQGSYVRSALQTLATPVQWCFTKVGEGISGYGSYFRTVESLREENRLLREELESNKNKVYDAELIEEENNFLRTYLGMKAENVSFVFADATVIGRESTNYRTVYTLSKGSMHGIEENMPVVTSSGLVGYVTEVGETYCRAVSVIENASSIGAYIERSGVLGIVEGRYDLRFDGLCCMTYIDAGSDIREGDKVLTSGVGSLYPRGIVIGEVTAIEYDEFNRTYVATVKPDNDFSKQTKVMIVTEFETASAQSDGEQPEK